MKNIQSNLLLLVLVLLIPFGAMSFTEPTPKENISPAVHRYFKFPSVLLHPESGREKTEQVEVLFTTDESGKVNFALARTDNEALKQEIEKQFYALPLKECAVNVVHKVVLRFRVA